VIYQRRIYTRAGEANNTTKMVCVELETGKVVGSAPCGGSCNEEVAADGRLFHEDSYQGPQMYATDPTNFRQLSAVLAHGRFRPVSSIFCILKSSK
jgi:hypothetical protein